MPVKPKLDGLDERPKYECAGQDCRIAAADHPFTQMGREGRKKRRSGAMGSPAEDVTIVTILFTNYIYKRKNILKCLFALSFQYKVVCSPLL